MPIQGSQGNVKKRGAWSNQAFSIPEGPSILFLKPLDAHHSFLKKSPFGQKRALDAKVGSLLQARPISGGSLLVEVRNGDQARAVLQLQTLLGIPIKADISINHNTTSGKIYSRDLMFLPEEEILAELQDQDVCGVVRMPTGKGHTEPNPVLRLLFRGRTIPHTSGPATSKFEWRSGWTPPGVALGASATAMAPSTAAGGTQSADSAQEGTPPKTVRGRACQNVRHARASTRPTLKTAQSGKKPKRGRDQRRPRMPQRPTLEGPSQEITSVPGRLSRDPDLHKAAPLPLELPQP